MDKATLHAFSTLTNIAEVAGKIEEIKNEHYQVIWIGIGGQS